MTAADEPAGRHAPKPETERLTAVFPSVARDWRWLIALALVAGALLRLSFPNDIEYKADERMAFNKVQDVGKTEPWPRLGEVSGAGKRNPAMSLWIFIALGKLFSADTPPELARIVQVLNVLALIGMVLFATKLVDRSEKKTWLWAMALAAVNPIGILLQRKIWIQSNLPPFCLATLAGWWKRDTRAGAFLWGAFGALLGQIHLSGFFFAAALLAWTVLFQGRIQGSKHTNRTTRWGFWLAGSACSAALMLPWFHYVLFNPEGHTVQRPSWPQILTAMGRAYSYWLGGEPVGLGLHYSIGREGVWALFKYPYLGGLPTYGIAAVSLAMFGLSTWLVLRAVLRVWEAGEWKAAMIGTASPTAFLIGMTLFGFIPLLSLPGMIHRHYMVVMYPVSWLWIARLAIRHHKKPDWILASIVLGQALISTTFLYFIHVNGGMPGADYGVSYRAQLAR